MENFVSKLESLNNSISFWVEIVIITSSDEESINTFLKENDINLKTVYGDATVLKTIIRSNPGFFLMRNGLVKGKWHNNSFPDPKDILRGVNITI